MTAAAVEAHSDPRATAEVAVLAGVEKAVGRRSVLRGVELEAAPGKITVVLGGSGSGKSTMLRILLGLESYDCGTARLFGREVKTLSRDEYRELMLRVGMLFQLGALFDSMTVFDNVAFPLREHSDTPDEELERRVEEAMNPFYQVFDKGTLSDGEGRIIDFKNTIIFLTSNIASSTIMNLCAEEYTADFDKLIEAVRPQLQSHFKPALLGRMTVIPYYPIKAAVLNEIIRSKLEKLSSRIFASQKLALAYDDEVVSMISRTLYRCGIGGKKCRSCYEQNANPDDF